MKTYAGACIGGGPYNFENRECSAPVIYVVFIPRLAIASSREGLISMPMRHGHYLWQHKHKYWLWNGWNDERGSKRA